ncbi:MAG: hypothetical protein LC644_08230 [Pseudonocardia sp.]|nr:hypothetical protein [Pseudonocardia sp.]
MRTTNLAERSVEGRRRTTAIVRLTSDLEHHPFTPAKDVGGSSVTVVVVGPLMTKIETNVMVVRLYFETGLPVSFVGDPRWPASVSMVKDLHEELP